MYRHIFGRDSLIVKNCENLKPLFYSAYFLMSSLRNRAFFSSYPSFDLREVMLYFLTK